MSIESVFKNNILSNKTALISGGSGGMYSIFLYKN